MTVETVAGWVVAAAGVYLGVGLGFAVAFVARGIGRLDPRTRDATWGFRLIVLPGAMALWPLLLARWLGGAAGPPVESTAHRRAAAASERSGAR
jgi:hypothetical protein